MSGAEIGIAVLVFAAIILLLAGFYAYAHHYRTRWEFARRMKQIDAAGVPGKQQTFAGSLVESVLRIAASLGTRVKPSNEDELSHLRVRFLRAGYRAEGAAVIFFGIKTVLAIATPAVFVLFKLAIRLIIPSTTFILLSLMCVGLGFYLPNLWLSLRIRGRKQSMQEGLPDALDLMVVCVEAGTGLDAAINRVGDEMKFSNKVVSEEFRQISMELRAGKDRKSALKNLALRTDLPDIQSLTSLLIQTEKFGTSLAQALRVHSDTMRVKRFQKAEEIASKLPVKLLFPLILFIFPSMFVTILGPGVIRILRVLLPSFGANG